MLGLRTRLGMARTLVWVGLQESPAVLTDLVRELCAGRADLVVVVQPGAEADDLVLGHGAAMRAGDGRTIIGLAADASVARRAKADLVATDAAATPAKGHEYSLSLAAASDARELERALADPLVDGVVLTPALVAVAAVLAPAAEPDSKPWFAQASSLAEGRSLIAAGARRLALESPPITAQTDLGMSPGEVVAAYRAALAASWGENLIAGPLGGISSRPNGLGMGRPTPDAPQPGAAETDEQWSGPHREPGPDDHW